MSVRDYQGGDEGVVDEEAFLRNFADRLILGGAWTWADGGEPSGQSGKST